MKDYTKSKIPRLFEIMEEKGIKGADITRDLHISSGNISDWKSGRHAPAYGIIVTIADYLGTTPEYLLGETDIKEKASVNGSKTVIGIDFGTTYTTQDTKLIAVTAEEEQIVEAYRNQPEVARTIVRRALGLKGISSDATTAAYGGKDTQVEKNKPRNN